MKIGVDLMGGDFAPRFVLEGALQAMKYLQCDDKLVLTGNMTEVNDLYFDLIRDLAQTGKTEFVHTHEVVSMSESPVKVHSRKPESSMAVGFEQLRKGETDVFISAGSSGAMLTGAVYHLKVVEGIHRPAISSFIPRENGHFGIIIDVGVNPDAKPEMLFQFGYLGSQYLKSIFKISDPKVALLNIGTEKEKGNHSTQAAFRLMDGTDCFHFIGNIEGYDILASRADVIVCDGFTGNIVIKTIEGLYRMSKRRNISDSFFDTFNYENYGGTPILGINKPVIVGHGVSSVKAFEKMILQGMEVVESGLITEIKNQIINQKIYQ